MKYRDVEYQVVQTINGSFRWSVQFDKLEKFGVLPRRDGAILHVKNLIDSRATLQTEVAAVAARSSA